MRIDSNPYAHGYHRAGARQTGKTEGPQQAEQTTREKPRQTVNEEAATVNLSASAKLLSQAQELLSQEEAPREEAIKRGQAIIEEWQGPSDAQIDAIFKKMFDTDSV